MKLTCYPTSGAAPEIRPAPLTRGWMDATSDRFAYRCLPLNIANQHGWEVLSPISFSAIWSGAPGKEAIRIETDGAEHFRPVSHFGYGVLTFHVNGLIRTPPGLNLWVGGSPNRVKDAIQPLNGVIETDWSPYSFTMNWMFTRPNWTVRFEKGEPICFFFPVPRGLVEAMEPEFMPIESDPPTQADHKAWVNARNQFLEELPIAGSKAQEQSWQKAYFRGNRPDGTPGHPEHQTKLAVRPFKPAP